LLRVDLLQLQMYDFYDLLSILPIQFEENRSPEAIVTEVIAEATDYCALIGNSYCDLVTCCADPYVLHYK